MTKFNREKARRFLQFSELIGYDIALKVGENIVKKFIGKRCRILTRNKYYKQFAAAQGVASRVTCGDGVWIEGIIVNVHAWPSYMLILRNITIYGKKVDKHRDIFKLPLGCLSKDVDLLEMNVKIPFRVGDRNTNDGNMARKLHILNWYITEFLPAICSYVPKKA